VHGQQSDRRAAVAWLERLVDSDGHVAFAIDPRSRTRSATGVMHHGRAAVVVRALAEGGARAEVVRRAKERLERDIAGALAGRSVEAWPADPAVVAGTLALARMAGVKAPLEGYARARTEIARRAWHAAQVVTALGRAAPPGLFRACTADLARRPWAPWTALAAARLGAARVLARSSSALVSSIGDSGPHEGGSRVTAVPEIALTAVCAEALAPLPSAEARSAAARARAFLRRWQLLPDRVPAALDPKLAIGAFPASPVADLLRGDITAHALLALQGA
jgi:hypothetical protein